MKSTYEVTSPQGKMYELEGPSGATQEQVLEKFKELRPDLFGENTTQQSPKSATEDLVSKIPVEPFTGVSTGAAEEKGLGSRMLEKAGQYAASLGPMGLAAGGALKLAGRTAPIIGGAGERIARNVAQALTPQTPQQLAQMAAGAGVAGATGEFAATKAGELGAPEPIAETARIAGEVSPSLAMTGSLS